MMQTRRWGVVSGNEVNGLLKHPLRWRKPWHVALSGDLFHEALTNEQIAAVFGVMVATPHITYQVLTKRLKRMREWFAWTAGSDAAHLCLGWARAMLPPGTGVGLHDPSWPLPNVWLGVSVENQGAADERIPDLLATPAAVRFISAEPLLELVRLHAWLGREHGLRQIGAPPGLHWVIAGAESGPGARPCDVGWLRSLRDQCTEARVPFFLKQARETDMGVCGDTDNPNGDSPCGERVRWQVLGPKDSSVACGCTVEGAEDVNGCPPVGFGQGSTRKRDGIIGLPYLDGVQHTAMPATGQWIVKEFNEDTLIGVVAGNSGTFRFPSTAFQSDTCFRFPRPGETVAVAFTASGMLLSVHGK